MKSKLLSDIDGRRDGLDFRRRRRGDGRNSNDSRPAEQLRPRTSPASARLRQVTVAWFDLRHETYQPSKSTSKSKYSA